MRTVTVQDVTREAVGFADLNGLAYMDSTTAVDMWIRANQTDSGWTRHPSHTRRFHRDDLAAVVDQLRHEYPCGNPDHWRNPRDLPGIGPDDLCADCSSAFAAMEDS